MTYDLSAATVREMERLREDLDEGEIDRAEFDRRYRPLARWLLDRTANHSSPAPAKP